MSFILQVRNNNVKTHLALSFHINVRQSRRQSSFVNARIICSMYLLWRETNNFKLSPIIIFITQLVPRIRSFLRKPGALSSFIFVSFLPEFYFTAARLLSCCNRFISIVTYVKEQDINFTASNGSNQGDSDNTFKLQPMKFLSISK